jgi:hypothetical protein
MARPEVLRYLRDNLKKFPTDDLRRQLAFDGVTDKEFDEAVKELRATQPTKVKARASGALGRFLMLLGAMGVVGAAALAIFQKPKTQGAEGPRSAPVESGFVGHAGYVVKLPSGYVAMQRFKDQEKTIELVHFCKAGTDPTNFLDEGLFGQLGIVRMEARPSPVPTDLTGLERLTSLVTSQAQQRGEKFTVKNLQISTLRGVQLTFDVPYPRVEAYILGEQMLYLFTAGQEDETYRSLVQSLRDARSEI